MVHFVKMERNTPRIPSLVLPAQAGIQMGPRNVVAMRRVLVVAGFPPAREGREVGEGKMVRPTAVYDSNAAKGLVWLADRFRAIDFLRSCDFLASKIGLEEDGNPRPALTNNVRQHVMADRLSKLRLESVQARFWEKVDVRGADECWHWKASRNRLGYGRFKYASYRGVSAHRASLIIHTDADHETLCVLHSCDTPSCVNPAHLRWGTQMDNTRDKIERGRQRFGDHGGFKNPRCTLTPEQLAEIVRLIDHTNQNNKQIAARYSITHAMISKIRTGNAWQKEVAAIRERKAA